MATKEDKKPDEMAEDEDLTPRSEAPSNADAVACASDLRSRFQTEWLELRERLGEKAVLRPKSQTKPMSWWTRKRTKALRCAKREDGESSSQQYYIPSAHEETSWDRLWERRRRTRTRLASLASPRALLLHFLITYFLAIIVFALFAQLIVRAYYDAGQECVTTYDYSKVTIVNTDNFITLFGLSWTTMSTVGYGVIGVATDGGCQGLRYFLAFEAFVGIMYSGYCGSIIFSNISTYLARAHVTFSSCICVQYGSGLAVPTGNCPVMRMRLVNDMAEQGAAICNANVQCLVVLSEDLSTDEISAGGNLDQDYLMLQTSNDMDNSQHTIGAKVETCKEVNISPNKLLYLIRGSGYFEHTLDENSPLLKDSVRERIRQNGGWPSDLNDYRKIRDSFSDDVDHIVVFMQGTSTLTLSSVFKSSTYRLDDIFIGFEFAELGFVSLTGASRNDTHIVHCIRHDLSLVNDIKPQSGGGSEPLGSRAHKRTSNANNMASTKSTEIDRRYLMRGKRRRNFDNLKRHPEETIAMNSVRRKWKSFSLKIYRCFRKNSNDDTDESYQQYVIPPVEEKRNLLLHGFHPFISITIWLYRTSMLYALLAFLLGYFVWIWIFALLVLAIDPICLSGWGDVPGGFFSSFYVPFQVSWCTFSTVGFGSVAPLAGVPCRGLNLVLAGEAFIGVIYSGFCGAIFYAKISRSESIANVSFSSVASLQYKGAAPETDSIAELDSGNTTHGGSYPFLEMRILNEDAQYQVMQGQIMDASVKCYVTSFKTKQDSDEQSNDDVVHIFSFGEGPNVDWKLTCDKLKLERNRQVVFAKAPWSFRHILDETSPLLKPTVRNQCRELGCWPPDINNHEKIRHCLSPDVNAIHVLFKGTANRTANAVFRVHEYKPEDIFVGWKHVGMGYLAKRKKNGETQIEVNFDSCLLNDIVPQSGGRADSLFATA